MANVLEGRKDIIFLETGPVYFHCVYFWNSVNNSVYRCFYPNYLSLIMVFFICNNAETKHRLWMDVFLHIDFPALHWTSLHLKTSCADIVGMKTQRFPGNSRD